MMEVMEAITDLVSDEDLNKAYGNANFGGMEKRDVIACGVLKVASGYYQGHTSTTIISELGLITSDYKLTIKGRLYLWLSHTKDRAF